MASGRLRAGFSALLVACGGASVAELSTRDGGPEPVPTGSSSVDVDGAPPPASDAAADTGVDAETDAGEDVLDGVCDEAAFATGVLDGDCVYVFADLGTPAAPRNVVLLPERPDVEVAAFPIAGSPEMGRKGRLVYRALTLTDGGTPDSELRQFAADPWDAGPVEGYPSDAIANDAFIETPVCPKGVNGVAFFPDDETTVYSCRGAAAFYAEATSQKLFDDVSIGELRALGRGRTALIGGGYRIVDTTGKMTTVVGIPPGGTFVAARSEGAGFVVALRFISSGVSSVRLFTIGVAGAASALGALDLGSHAGPARAVIDSQRRVHGIVSKKTHNVVVRFAVGAPPVVRFDESTHRARIVTSPWALLTSP